MNFVLTDLSSAVTLTQTGNLTSQVLSISGDAVAVYLVKTSEIKKVFQFETDAINVNDLSAQDMKFYVDMSSWPSALNPLNPANAMMDVPVYSSGAISSISKISGAAYDHNKALVKHDFIRYIAQKMFNTYQAVDLFNNQLGVIQNIETVCDGSAAGHSWHDISAALHSVSTNGTNPGLLVDNNSLKYMTVATTTPDNLSRELFLQIVGNQPDRLTANADGSSRVLGSADRQDMLLSIRYINQVAIFDTDEELMNLIKSSPPLGLITKMVNAIFVVLSKPLGIAITASIIPFSTKSLRNSFS
jgi:hypothetical protein